MIVSCRPPSYKPTVEAIAVCKMPIIIIYQSIYGIYIALLQGNYSEAFPAQAYACMGIRTFTPDISLRMNSSITLNKCHKSNFYFGIELCPSIQLKFEQRTCFIKYKGHLDQFLG